MFAKQGGGTPHIPIEGIWSDIQARVGTPHKILTCLRSKGGGHRTFQLRENIDVHQRVGTPHMNMCLGGGHRTFQLRGSSQIFNLGWGHHTKF